MANEIVVSSGTAVALHSRQSLPIQSMGDIEKVGDWVARSGLIPGLNPASGMLVACTCYQEKKSPLDFQRTYDIIAGRVTKKAKASLVEFVQAGGRYHITKYANDEVAAVFEMGDNRIELNQTMQELIDNGVALKNDGVSIKDNYIKFPRRMLWARLISEACGLLAPGITCGIYTPEEVSDFDEVRNASLPMDDQYVSAEPMPMQMPMSAPAPAPAPVEQMDDSNPEVCNYGNVVNKRWESLDDDMLDYALSEMPLGPKTRAYIESVVAARKSETEETSEPDAQPVTPSVDAAVIDTPAESPFAVGKDSTNPEQKEETNE